MYKSQALTRLDFKHTWGKRRSEFDVRGVQDSLPPAVGKDGGEGIKDDRERGNSR
jgi:hypothetical protein